MNEQIQKLCKQAFSLAHDENDRNVQEEGEELTQTEFNNFFYVKFAELILKECISKADDYGLGYDAVEQLKADFGVE